MEGWPKYFTILAAESPDYCVEVMGSGWYVAQGGECVYVLECWMENSYDPTIVVENLAQVEGLDVSETVFFELCTRRVHETITPDESWYRMLTVYCDVDEETPFVVSGFTWERCSLRIQEAFAGLLKKISAQEELKVSKGSTRPIEFREVAYQDPASSNLHDDCSFALYTFLDHGTCLFAKVAAGNRYQWEDSIPIVLAIIEQEHVDPMDIIFHDATPGPDMWGCVTVSGSEGSYLFSVVPDMPHQPYYGQLVEDELVLWSGVASSEDAEG
ncbi:hypothetical protein BK004_01960 [bacterium CG10_46_32]|nr:MAG: hypothetical protein BK004_01960 [bacterium CG10_46_32]PIR56200.1 MAG: hypothetical protein COU73_01985 [Parcubacteria group bacterium CG10_big_fil_rev_8_21_14_0_10_46_32]